MYKILNLLIIALFSVAYANSPIVINPDQIPSSPIELDSNAVTLSLPSNPSTGYEWVIVDYSDSIQVNSIEYVAPNDQLIGQPGSDLISIQFNENWEKSYIDLKYSRSWEIDENPTVIRIYFQPKN
ncbi:MAG: hypothetical protein CMF42_04615 [Legionellales bacterium]|nr:hypothetical protein [Legionellales bacterium]OUX67301.1 MAG: hypothetical protein CBD38_02805 [bacterium TMED178]|tara:strand:+ start:11531 stop:11908 length:378 start_codon:yes stop_codon:yes gene_type:complete